MAKIVYSPDIITSFIRYVYASREEFDRNSENSILDYVPFYLNDIMSPTGQCSDEVQIIPGITKENICIIQYNKYILGWNIYHCSDNIFSEGYGKNIFEKIKIPSILYNLDPSKTYIAFIINYNINIIQSIDANGNVYNFSSDEIYFYDVESDRIYQKQYVSDHSDNFIKNKQKDYKNFNNIFAISRQKGIICLNPGNCIDYIFCLLTASNEKRVEISEILASEPYYEACYSAFKNFSDKFVSIQNQKPSAGYGIVYKYFKDNDEIYFNNKIKMFQDQVINILGKIKPTIQSNLALFIAEFVTNFRNDICIEFSTLYHRFRYFPRERDIIYRKYRNHPYIKILKIVHSKYLRLKKITPSISHITPDIISNILFDNPQNIECNSYFIYNENINLLIAAIKDRSKLFGPIYEIYLETKKKDIKPKYRTKYNYFPFKVFSPYIFIMEHILSIAQ